MLCFPHKIAGWLLVIVMGAIFLWPLSSISQPTVYLLKQSPQIDKMIVQVERNEPKETELALPNADSGIAPQIQNIVCDGHLLIEIKPQVWDVPKDCKHLEWQIPLFVDSAIQGRQSVKSGDLIVISEASSLPHLKDAETEVLKIGISPLKSIFPLGKVRREIILSRPHTVPWFILLNPITVATVSSKQTQLMYFLDAPQATNKLPDMFAHMEGIRWLNKIVPSRTQQQFKIAWLGVPLDKVYLTGAVGPDIFLANYEKEGELPFGKAMLLYVVLHQAFHQIATNKNPTLAIWLSESLASYYGMRALQIALPDDPNTAHLLESFKANADHFTTGLLTIDHQVETGDFAKYAAFYSKGMVFWMTVDSILQETHNQTLDQYLKKLLQLDGDTKEPGQALQKILHITSKKWRPLQKRFLEQD